MDAAVRRSGGRAMHGAVAEQEIGVICGLERIGNSLRVVYFVRMDELQKAFNPGSGRGIA